MKSRLTKYLLVILILIISVFVVDKLIKDKAFINPNNVNNEIRVSNKPLFYSLEECITIYLTNLKELNYENLDLICGKKSEKYYQKIKNKLSLRDGIFPYLTKAYEIDSNFYRCDFSMINEDGAPEYLDENNSILIELNPENQTFVVYKVKSEESGKYE